MPHIWDHFHENGPSVISTHNRNVWLLRALQLNDRYSDSQCVRSNVTFQTSRTSKKKIHILKKHALGPFLYKRSPNMQSGSVCSIAHHNSHLAPTLDSYIVFGSICSSLSTFCRRTLATLEDRRKQGIHLLRK